MEAALLPVGERSSLLLLDLVQGASAPAAARRTFIAQDSNVHSPAVLGSAVLGRCTPDFSILDAQAGLRLWDRRVAPQAAVTTVARGTRAAVRARGMRRRA